MPLSAKKKEIKLNKTFFFFHETVEPGDRAGVPAPLLHLPVQAGMTAEELSSRRCEESLTFSRKGRRAIMCERRLIDTRLKLDHTERGGGGREWRSAPASLSLILNCAFTPPITLPPSCASFTLSPAEEPISVNACACTCQICIQKRVAVCVLYTLPYNPQHEGLSG